MDSHTDPETVKSLQLEHSKFFTPLAETSDEDAYSLAQPSPLRYVPSFVSDRTISPQENRTKPK